MLHIYIYIYIYTLTKHGKWGQARPSDGPPRSRGSILRGTRDLLLLQSAQTGSETHLDCYSICTGVKWPGRKANTDLQMPVLRMSGTERFKTNYHISYQHSKSTGGNIIPTRQTGAFYLLSISRVSWEVRSWGRRYITRLLIWHTSYLGYLYIWTLHVFFWPTLPETRNVIWACRIPGCARLSFS